MRRRILDTDTWSVHGLAERTTYDQLRRPVSKPAGRSEIAQGVGHVLQLEVPNWTITLILNWLETDGSTAALAAT